MYIKNKEVENIQYYDSYCGYKFIDDYSDNYLKSLLKNFIHERKSRVKELHVIISNYKYFCDDCATRTRMDYISTMGLGYYCGHAYGKEINSESVMSPLVYINEDYCKHKIHVIEVELCYINKNIKAIKRVIRSRKSK